VTNRHKPDHWKNRDPKWDARRVRVDRCMLATFGIILLSFYWGPSMASIVVGPAFIFMGGVMAAYMGVAEWGRINNVYRNETFDSDNLGNPAPPPF